MSGMNFKPIGKDSQFFILILDIKILIMLIFTHVRKVNSTFQLIAVLFLLKVINLEALTLRDISGSLNRDVNEYKAPYSSVLRVAIASSMYLALGKTTIKFLLIKSYPILINYNFKAFFNGYSI